MAIRPSSGKQIEALVADLTAADAVTRDTAAARLTVIGARAVDRVLALAESKAPSTARAAAWRTLEAIGDVRALASSLRTADDRDPAVAAAAIGAARVFLRDRHGAAVVDRLTAIALDHARVDAIRIAALRALEDLDAATRAPLLAALARDPSRAVRAEASGSRDAAPDAIDLAELLKRAAGGTIGDDPDALRLAVHRGATDLPLPLLLLVVERVRDREGAEPPKKRPAWSTVRAAAHVALAQRGSRLALYDLRDSLAAAESPLPVEFLTALTLVGDASCLESMAAAYARSSAAARVPHDWWREHLADAFRAIVARERITRRHAVMKRLKKRWGGLIDEMADG